MTEQMKKNLNRVFISIAFPSMCLYMYISDLDGAYSELYVSWGIISAVLASILIFSYFPVAYKVKRGSMIWNLGLAIAVLVPIVLLIVSIVTWDLKFWARSVAIFSILIAGTHVSALRYCQSCRSSQSSVVEGLVPTETD